MPSVPLQPPQLRIDQYGALASPANPFPHLLQTPSGLALLEIQGTLHTHPPKLNSNESDVDSMETFVGRLVFPFYGPDASDAENHSWMKRVYLYVGKHQRLTGEVQKLPKAIAVIRKRETTASKVMELEGKDTLAEREESLREELEILEIIKYKILFAARPEPVGD